MKLLTFLITLSFFLISCDTLPFNDRGETKDYLTENLTLSQSQFDSINDVVATFTVKNNSSQTLRFKFPSGCVTGFTVTKGDSTYNDSRDFLMCTAVITELTFLPNKETSFPVSLYLLDEDFVADFEPGEYQLNAFLLEGHSDTASANFEVVSQD